jgi:hypothetical protein
MNEQQHKQELLLLLPLQQHTRSSTPEQLQPQTS